MSSLQRFLHPTDFSDNSRYALETACALAPDYDATILILHVVMPSESPLVEAPPPEPLRSVEPQRSQMHPLWPQPPDPQFREEHRLAEGEPAAEVLRLARAQRCDLIVMGTHGKTGLGWSLAGRGGKSLAHRGRSGNGSQVLAAANIR